MLLASVVETANAVAATSARTVKVAHLARLLGKTAPEIAPVVVGLLTGEIRQGRIGVGWAAVREVSPARAEDPTLTIVDIDDALTKLAAATGPGSQAKRAEMLNDLFGAATEVEAEFVAAVLTGGLRQGALDGVMTASIATAAGVPQAAVRRASMLSGDLGEVATIALTAGRKGLAEVGLRVGRGVLPMLAATSASVADAITELGDAVVQAKLDGIRLQVHRDGPDVALYTRNLNEVSARLLDVCELALGFPAESFVLDGELIGVSEDSPELFQDTASTFNSGGDSGRVALRTSFFDILHRDGVDLIDEPLVDRLVHLQDVVGSHVIDWVQTDDVSVAEGFERAVLDAGQEGVMVKAVDSPYSAGKRGKTWRKVKPVHTYDLVVIGAEWGHGRREGWLSNLHLAAREPGSGPNGGDGFVMVGKTFKGLTDEVLTWQTERLLELQEDRPGRDQRRDAITVFVRPELVVEIAIDGVQRSTTYDGGLALRFARVKGYRQDKTPAEANTLTDLKTLL